MSAPGRRLAALLLLPLLATAAWAQEGAATGDHQRANESFFGPTLVLLLLFSTIVLVVLSVRRGRSRPSKLPKWTDETFEEEVLEAHSPVLVHFSREWDIANKATLAQTEVLAYLLRGNVRVGLLEVDECPGVMERFPDFVAPAYLLFYQGRKLLHRAGLQQADDLQQQVEAVLSREGF